MEIEEALGNANGFGLYQKMALVFLPLQASYNGLQSSLVNIISPAQEHWCRVPGLGDYPHEFQKKLAIPSGTEEGTYDSCHYYNLPWENYTHEQLLTLNRSVIEATADRVPCDDWVFNQDVYTRTMLTEFHAVCSTSWLPQLASTLYATGLLFGNVVHGPVSDAYGRKFAALLFSTFLSAALFGCAFCPDPISFIALRTVVGLMMRATSSSSIVLMAEITGAKYRAIGGNGYTVMYASGLMIQAGIGFALRDYIHLHIVTATLAAVNLGLYFVLKESPRWLLSKGRQSEAEEVIRWIGNVNNSPLPKDFQLKLPNAQQEVEPDLKESKDSKPSKQTKTDQKVKDDENFKPSTSVLVTNPVLRKHLLLVTYFWFTASFANMGITMNMSTLSGNIYVTMLISGALDIPVGVVCFFMMSRFGRKPVVRVCAVVMLVVNSVAIVLEIFPETRFGATILSLVAKASASGVLAILFTITSELFPTPLRQRALGISNLGTVAGIFAPFLGQMKARFAPSLNIILTAICFFFVIFVHFIPETLGTKIPDTVEEAENISKRHAKMNVEAIGAIYEPEVEPPLYSTSTDQLFVTHF